MFDPSLSIRQSWVLKGGVEAMATLDQAPEGGARFPVAARLDGRTFVTFHVDLGVGDEILEPLDELVGEDWLGFVGIGPVVALALSREQHWAEKLHAHTRPRAGAASSRVRDLLDLVFLIERRVIPSVGGPSTPPSRLPVTASLSVTFVIDFEPISARTCWSVDSTERRPEENRRTTPS